MTGGGAGEDDLGSYLDFAGRLAAAARAVTLEHFRRGIASEAQADLRPVTAADRESEAAMRAMIAEAYPHHGIIGEEQGSERADAEYVWILDPIDGTRSFASGKATYGILVALAHNGRPIVGVMDEPPLASRWQGALGRPTTLDGREVRVRPCAGVGQAWRGATSPHMFREGI